MAANSGAGGATARGLVRGPQSLLSGLVLVALAAFALWLVSDLSQGTLRAMGPAMLPRWLAIGVGLCGLALVAAAFMHDGSPLESYTIRGPVMVVLGVLAFAITIRGFDFGAFSIPQLGMIVAGPISIFVGGFATPDVRWRELLILALGLTAACMILFGDLLNLPIPLYPQWLSDLYPAGWSNDLRMRATAGIMAVLAFVLWLASPKTPAEPIDVVPEEHAGTV